MSRLSTIWKELIKNMNDSQLKKTLNRTEQTSDNRETYEYNHLKITASERTDLGFERKMKSLLLDEVDANDFF